MMDVTEKIDHLWPAIDENMDVDPLDYYFVWSHAWKELQAVVLTNQKARLPQTDLPRR